MGEVNLNLGGYCMKKCKWSILAVILTMMFMVTPATAKGDMSGFYVGLKFIDSIQGHWTDVKGTNDDIGGWGNTVGGALFVGYDFYYKFDVPVRTEIEYALRSDWTGNDTLHVTGGWIDVDTKVNVQTLLFNVYYDFRNSTKFTPYVGAGIGLAFSQSYATTDAFLSNGTPVVHYSGSGYSTNFAWQVGAGVSYAISDNVSADLGYRYLGLNFDNDDISSSHSGAHEFSLGLRITF